jgi:hypothetical protein
MSDIRLSSSTDPPRSLSPQIAAPPELQSEDSFAAQAERELIDRLARPPRGIRTDLRVDAGTEIDRNGGSVPVKVDALPVGEAIDQ